MSVLYFTSQGIFAFRMDNYPSQNFLDTLDPTWFPLINVNIEDIPDFDPCMYQSYTYDTILNQVNTVNKNVTTSPEEGEPPNPPFIDNTDLESSMNDLLQRIILLEETIDEHAPQIARVISAFPMC